MNLHYLSVNNGFHPRLSLFNFSRVIAVKKTAALWILTGYVLEERRSHLVKLKGMQKTKNWSTNHSFFITIYSLLLINLILQNWRKVWFWLLGWTQCYNQAWSSQSWSWNGCQQTAKRQCQKENHKPWWHPLLYEAAPKIGSTGKTYTCTETKLNFSMF